MNYILGVDNYEGNPVIDEAVLKAAGVQFMIVRLNDMNGGHHRDVNFDSQWAQAAPFIHWPYFVYNPWVSGQENFNWLNSNIPADATAVSVDIEVSKPGYAPAEYGRQVAAFLALAAPRWKLNIYTGKWFEAVLTPWPTSYEYWYARYPFIVYPPARENWTWEKLKQIMYNMTWSPGAAPGPCHLWQITGDRLILPGCGETCVDINAWKGTLAELQAFAGYAPPPLTLEQRVTNIEAWIEAHG
jgi:hypothetical protein